MSSSLLKLKSTEYRSRRALAFNPVIGPFLLVRFKPFPSGLRFLPLMLLVFVIPLFKYSFIITRVLLSEIMSFVVVCDLWIMLSSVIMNFDVVCDLWIMLSSTIITLKEKTVTN